MDSISCCCREDRLATCCADLREALHLHFPSYLLPRSEFATVADPPLLRFDALERLLALGAGW